ncbi:Bax inhibitor-1/YccA family protein [bacterium]|nr:Bax inhibitor-1/YccA family protein [bacterium]
MNPILSEKSFKNQVFSATQSGTMTVQGTIGKSILLLIMLMAGAAYTWKIYYEATSMASLQSWMIGGVIAGLVLAMIISFAPKSAPFLAPIYAAAEGLAIGGLSAFYNDAFAQTAPNIVMNAVGLTIVCMLVTLLLYRSGKIRVTSKFVRIMTIGMVAILIYYLGIMIAQLFGANLTLLTGSSPLSIGISLAIVFFAAFSLILDFDFIQKASAAGSPKYMEWYGAFGLMVTLVWLYLEILKLLAKIAGSRE